LKESQGIAYIFHISQVSALYKINNTDSSGRDYRICSHWASSRLIHVPSWTNFTVFYVGNHEWKPRHRREHNIKMYIIVSSWLDSYGSRQGSVIDSVTIKRRYILTSWATIRFSSALFHGVIITNWRTPFVKLFPESKQRDQCPFLVSVGLVNCGCPHLMPTITALQASWRFLQECFAPKRRGHGICTLYCNKQVYSAISRVFTARMTAKLCFDKFYTRVSKL
jgi:hypothetical protein